ncbi:MAG: 4Fe-4S binding protein [Deltaproteobacteria bacterium]|nr:4Fe-4S binding protein [Deltaproteobacteria bacterium]
MSTDDGTSAGRPVHYVEVDEDLCNGCVLCMKACPMKAIRLRDHVARIEGVCIDCMECARVCPRGAIRGVSSVDVSLGDRSEDAVCPSTVLYSQFGEDFLPNDVLLGLRSMGFRYPFDQAYTAEIYEFAMELFIREQRKSENPPFPLISAVCPAVVQIIAYRFPSLLRHIPPLATPREIVTREAKQRLSAKHGRSPEEIQVLHVVPCPAMMIREADQTNRDRAVGINAVYDELKKSIQEIEEDRVLHYSGGIGLGWGISGGESAGIQAKSIAVSGIHETIRYLERVEMGLLSHIEFLECRICTEGCVGGSFNVADRYQTKQLVQRYVRMFGEERRVKQKYLMKLYREGWFQTERQVLPIRTENIDMTIAERIEQQKRVESILRELPKKHCGMCGSPDCRTFAEDVVAGKARLDNCTQLEHLGGKGVIT